MLFNFLRLSVLFLILITFSFSPLAESILETPENTDTLFNPTIKSMIDQVDQAQSYTLMGDLSGEWPVSIGGQMFRLETRDALSGESNQKAAEYLFQYYQALGLETSYQNFTFQDHTLSNVVAEKAGTIFPERVFMITSHFDDVPVTPPAPGADDNASGTAAVMLAASILSKHEFGCTLRFANFNAEEYGLIGSKDYARRTYCAGEDLLGVLNLDMIAWNSLYSPPEVDLHINPSLPGSSTMGNLFAEVVNTYGLQLIPTDADPATNRSDHFSFWQLGYPAILVSEDLNDFNPNYHSPEDRLGNLQDFDYYVEMIKASLGTLAHSGCLVEDGWGSISGQVTSLQTQDPIPGANLSLTNPEWAYTFTTQADEQGYYQFSALAGTHILTADSIDFKSKQLEVLVTENQDSIVDLELNSQVERVLYLPLTGDWLVIQKPGCPELTE